MKICTLGPTATQLHVSVFCCTSLLCLCFSFHDVMTSYYRCNEATYSKTPKRVSLWRSGLSDNMHLTDNMHCTSIFTRSKSLVGVCVFQPSSSCDLIGDSDSNSDDDVDPFPMLQDQQIRPTARKAGKYKWDKRHACKYCSKLVLKMSTHLQDRHSDESEVAQILVMPKNSKERRNAWGKLLNEGDWQHNYNVLRNKKGTLIQKYRSDRDTVEDFVACSHCKGLYHKRVLSVHWRHCSQKMKVIQVIQDLSAKDGFFILSQWMSNPISTKIFS